MKSNEQLRQTLLTNADKLFNIAETICKEKDLALHAIYQAVYKVKQKYKQLANKERAVDLCLSYIKQPGSKNKMTFISVEDAIDKALSAKVFPLRPVISTVALLLVAAILIPYLLPQKARTVDASGFVMENTVALENLVSGSDVELKNMHTPENLGVADPLAEFGHEYNSAQHIIYCDTLTTANGVTLFFMTYADGEEKKGGCLVYEAHEDGWHEVAHFETYIGTVTRWTEYWDENNDRAYEWRTFRYASRISVLADEKGNAYILTQYKEGLQIHRYGADGEVELLDQAWLTEQKPMISDLGMGTSNAWDSNIFAGYDQSAQRIQIFTSIQTGYQAELESIFLYFDIASEKFSQVIVGNEETPKSARKMVYDGEGGFYTVDTAVIEGSEDENGMISEAFAVLRIKDGEVLSKTPLVNGNVLKDNVTIELLEMEGTNLHLVYRTKSAIYYMIFDENGEILQKKRCYVVSADPTNYLHFVRYQDELYYLCIINKNYLVLARVGEDGRPIKAGEFLLPYICDDSSNGIYAHWHKTPFLTGDNVLNVILLGAAEGIVHHDPTTYFMQIILK